MSDAGSLLTRVAVSAFATVLLHVALGAVLADWNSRARVRQLRHRRKRRAEALAEILDKVEAVTAEAPEDLLAALGAFGPDWRAEHLNYGLAARALATEFRTLRNASPDPTVDVKAVQHELRMMLKARKCRNKDAIRIMPLALVMVFYKSDYEQIVEHAFAEPIMRDRISVSQDEPMQRTWYEWMFGGYRNPVPKVV